MSAAARPRNPARSPRAIEIIVEVAGRHGCTLQHLMRDDRGARVSRIRHEAMAEVRSRMPDITNTAIARAFQRDPTTITYGLKRYQQRALSRDQPVAESKSLTHPQPEKTP